MLCNAFQVALIDVFPLCSSTLSSHTGCWLSLKITAGFQTQNCSGSRALAITDNIQYVV